MADLMPPPWLVALILARACTTQRLAGPITTTNNGGIRQVLHRAHQYPATLLHGDIELPSSVLADRFLDTGEHGALRDKRRLLRIIADQPPPASIIENDRKIQINGNTAVATVQFVAGATDPGKPYKSAGRATDVWLKRNGQWYCVAAHSRAMRQGAERDAT